MFRRMMCGALTLMLVSPALSQTTQPRDAQAAQAVAAHRAPGWWRDAKFGMFIHWGLYSVPGYAPPDAKEADSTQPLDASSNPYAEWYYNTLRIPGSLTARFHQNAYGNSFDYYDFRKIFQAASADWNPDNWAAIFAKAGARYAVLTAKHCDGYLLWPSAVHHPSRPSDTIESPRDLVGDFAAAMRRRGIHPGVYYSSLFDWSVRPALIRSYDDFGQQSSDQGPAYAQYVDDQWRELISRYRPDILWSDVGYPAKGDAYGVIVDYLKAVPDGVVDDRWDPFKIGDFATPEYSKYAQISEQPWEMTRGIGKSFGLNRVEPVEDSLTGPALIELLIDVVSKNGNLLLDVGPEPDGSLRPVDIDRLAKLGAWLSVNGAAIYATRPWTRYGDTLADGTRVRYTVKGGTRYAILLDAPKSGTLVLPAMPGVTDATMVAGDRALAITRQGDAIRIILPGREPRMRFTAIRLASQPSR